VADLVFKEWNDYKNGNALVADLVFKEWNDYKNGNALVAEFDYWIIIMCFLFSVKIKLLLLNNF